MEFFIVLFWIAFSVLVGVFAQVRRNREGIVWFFLALILSPIIAGVLVAILRESEPRLGVLDRIHSRFHPNLTPDETAARLPLWRFLIVFGLLWLVANYFHIV
jgi:hypothetical protein